MNRIIFYSLTLEGFGLYGKRATFRFHEGLNTLVSPNETGKSTLLAGILAVLFGLPEKNDPDAWGTTRFQSWTSPLPFRAEALLRANGFWHRIRRDFATHEVDWAVAASDEQHRTAPDSGAPQDPEDAASDPAPPEPAPPEPAPPKPSSKVWKVHFRDEHSPTRRGESVGRYRQHLRDLLGIDDQELFRLTFCLAQDLDERTEDEDDFRTREVPRAIRELLGGSGGRVDDVRTLLFDAFADVTMATGDADLVRPGKKRARNQGTPGHLERVTNRLTEARNELRAAANALEALLGSQEKLEEIRRERDEKRRKLEDHRKLLAAWDGWSAARAERRNRQKHVVEMETAVRQMAGAAALGREAEEQLRTSYPECRDPAFPFDDQQQALEQLVDLEEEQTRIRKELDHAHHQERSLEKQIAEIEADIQTRFASFARQPHLLRDFQTWQQTTKEADETRAALADLQREIDDSEGALQQISRWAALDADAQAQATHPRPAAKLKDLCVRVPTFLERAAEVETLGKELSRIRRRLKGPLQAISDAPEELREEARASDERRRLLRVRAEEATRRTEEAQARAEQLRSRTASLAKEKEFLAKSLGQPEPEMEPERGPGADRDPHAEDETAEQARTGLPPSWESLRAAMEKKLGHLREEGDLLRQASSIPRMVRPTSSRQILLPTVVAFVVAAAAGFAAASFLVPEMSWRLLTALLAGLVAAIVTAGVTFRKSSATVLQDLPAALQGIEAVRHSIEEANRRLGVLRDLDSRALDDLFRRLEVYAGESSSMASLRGSIPSAADLDRLNEETEQAAAGLSEFEARISVLGEDPAGDVTEWTELTRRISQITARLADLENEVGAPDWSNRAISELPPAWGDLLNLASVIAERIPVGAHAPGSPPDVETEEEFPALQSGGEVAHVLRQIAPADWDTWIMEATRFEQAHARLISLRSRLEALEAGDDQGKARLDRLAARLSELAATCAPFTLDASEEEVAWAAQEYEKRNAALEKARTLHEKTTSDLSGLKDLSTQKEAECKALRDDLEGLLTPASGNTERSRERLREAARLREKLARGTESEEQVLRSHGVHTAQELRLKMEALREESSLALKSIRETEEEFPLLRELSDADPTEIQKRHNELTRQVDAIDEETQHLETDREALQRSAAEAGAEGRRVGNVAVLELEVRSLDREREQLLLERDALRIAFETVGQAEDLFGQTYREHLAERSTEIFRQITLQPDRSVQLDEGFEIRVLEPDGHSCAPRQLSQGARDQLALALRLAVTELLSSQRLVPLLFDDPFLAFDPDRLAAMREALEHLAAERQIFVLSHREELASWGTRVEIER